MKTEPNDSAQPLTIDLITTILNKKGNDGLTLNGMGLTKREHFAAMAMQGLLANHNIINNNTKSAGEYLAAASVDLADALITALNK